MSDLPPCGIYRTTLALADHVPAGRLVYFHDHGDPGPGVYLPSGWTANRAHWHEHGHQIPSPAWAMSLEPLPPEGFYRVVEPFTCCAKRCREFQTDFLVQLGYDAAGEPLVFVPEWTAHGVALPDTGVRIDADRLARLAPLRLVETRPPGDVR